MSKKEYIETIQLILVIALFYGFLQLIGITCPIKFMTGISCPGCGMTRAWLSLLFRQDLCLAFSYHPLFWIVPPGILVLFFRGRLPRRFVSFCLYLAILLFLLVYARRLYDQTDTIVVFQPQNGFFIQTLTRLYHLIQPILS